MMMINDDDDDDDDDCFLLDVSCQLESLLRDRESVVKGLSVPVKFQSNPGVCQSNTQLPILDHPWWFNLYEITAEVVVFPTFNSNFIFRLQRHASSWFSFML